jgi:hypothetical protein
MPPANGRYSPRTAKFERPIAPSPTWVVCCIIHLKVLLSEFLLEKGEVWFTSPTECGE